MLLISIQDLTPDQLATISTYLPQGMSVYHVASPDEIATILYQDVQIWITYGEDVTEKWLEHMPNLLWIQIFQAGVEQLPLGAIKDRSIQLTNMKGIHGIPMTEYVLSMLFYSVGNLSFFEQLQKKRYWDETAQFEEIHRKSVTIFGAGTIGVDIARALKALGLHVAGVNTSGVKKEPFDEMYQLHERYKPLAESDVVILLMPITDDTKYCIGYEELSIMKESSCLINIGRGPLIDDNALIDALEHKKIGHAILDVFDKEPLPFEHPYWYLPNVMVTPHVAAKSPLYLDRCIEQFEGNMKAFIKKTEMNYIVNVQQGY
ncbi:D-2-hydroxyacid dehydrogenase [Pontibacillus yanchengensis]|uniref:D-2-hydroxyacid dehydrogenase n=2 Tax=Pontibacillus yanchengensis TaxID=462910 RepID=A0ACC7VG57_9BACI|nr:D-2-hydroxyacid dehydrogenase [Pontibacillus yanchengensis]MYL32514.1 D-2-hydroxyacid dehydrogenase [Pontibacillus yanchengensis]MYL53095.1 D-2-hydroxyacid dehydrogenase [Pontibacillus yanchengensis]